MKIHQTELAFRLEERRAKLDREVDQRFHRHPDPVPIFIERIAVLKRSEGMEELRFGLELFQWIDPLALSATRTIAAESNGLRQRVCSLGAVGVRRQALENCQAALRNLIRWTEVAQDWQPRFAPTANSLGKALPPFQWFVVRKIFLLRFVPSRLIGQ